MWKSNFKIFFIFQNDKRMEQRFSKIEERAQVNKAVPKSDSTSLQDWESIESPDSLQCKKILMLIIWLEYNPSNYKLAKNVKNLFNLESLFYGWILIDLIPNKKLNYGTKINWWSLCHVLSLYCEIWDESHECFVMAGGIVSLICTIFWFQLDH